MHDEDDLLPISAVSHLAFCERRCALLHTEGLWEDNRFTVEGRLLHQRTHAQEVEVRAGVRIVRGLRLRSLTLGLWGQADVVEFPLPTDGADEPPWVRQLASAGGMGAGAGANPAPASGQQTMPRHPYPVEYKRGKPRPEHCDSVQLCAQAICLEEMLGVPVPEGAIYHGQPRRRTAVTLTPELRAQTAALAARLHELIRSGRTPPPSPGKHCKSCSLVELCLPATVGRRSARRYLADVLTSASDEEVQS